MALRATTTAPVPVLHLIAFLVVVRSLHGSFTQNHYAHLVLFCCYLLSEQRQRTGSPTHRLVFREFTCKTLLL